MSRQNVAVVRAAVEASSSGDPDWWHPEGEYVNASGDPDHATYRGIEAITKLFDSWFQAYPDIRVVPLEVRVVGERVFAWTRYSGHGATSGLPFEMELANVMTVEDGKIRRLEVYMDRAEALEALGRTE
jgi:ketosteroid isomerase-like protein